jgi:hypothetical protein
LLAPQKKNVMRLKLKDVLKKKESKMKQKLIISDLFGNLGNFVWLPLTSKCDEIEVERCVEEEESKWDKN